MAKGQRSNTVDIYKYQGNSNNVLTFNTNDQRDAYFTAKDHIHLDNVMVTPMNNNLKMQLKIGMELGLLKSYNYVRVGGYSDDTFYKYCFIDNATYINDNLTLLDLSVDVWTSHMPIPKMCYIERSSDQTNALNEWGYEGTMVKSDILTHKASTDFISFIAVSGMPESDKIDAKLKKRTTIFRSSGLATNDEMYLPIGIYGWDIQPDFDEAIRRLQDTRGGSCIINAWSVPQSDVLRSTYELFDDNRTAELEGRTGDLVVNVGNFDIYDKYTGFLEIIDITNPSNLCQIPLSVLTPNMTFTIKWFADPLSGVRYYTFTINGNIFVFSVNIRNDIPTISNNYGDLKSAAVLSGMTQIKSDALGGSIRAAMQSSQLEQEYGISIGNENSMGQTLGSRGVMSGGSAVGTMAVGGGAIGSAVPGAGTAVGATVGGIAGFVGGVLGPSITDLFNNTTGKAVNQMQGSLLQANINSIQCNSGVGQFGSFTMGSGIVVKKCVVPSFIKSQWVNITDAIGFKVNRLEVPNLRGVNRKFYKGILNLDLLREWDVDTTVYSVYAKEQEIFANGIWLWESESAMFNY